MWKHQEPGFLFSYVHTACHRIEHNPPSGSRNEARGGSRAAPSEGFFEDSGVHHHLVWWWMAEELAIPPTTLPIVVWWSSTIPTKRGCKIMEMFSLHGSTASWGLLEPSITVLGSNGPLWDGSPSSRISKSHVDWSGNRVLKRVQTAKDSPLHNQGLLVRSLVHNRAFCCVAMSRGCWVWKSMLYKVLGMWGRGGSTVQGCHLALVPLPKGWGC